MPRMAAGADRHRVGLQFRRILFHWKPHEADNLAGATYETKIDTQALRSSLN